VLTFYYYPLLFAFSFGLTLALVALFRHWILVDLFVAHVTLAPCLLATSIVMWLVPAHHLLDWLPSVVRPLWEPVILHIVWSSIFFYH
jgi:hypothetical protein